MIIQNTNNIALIQKNKKLSYKELLTISNEIYAKINKRALIGIVSYNAIPCICAYVASFNNNCVSIMLPNNQKSIQKYTELFNVEYLFIKSEDNFLDSEVIFELDGFVLLKLRDTKLIADNNLALLLSTSGSTGDSKFVRLSYENILTNTNAVCKSLKLTNNHKTISTLPLNYSFGLSIINTFLHSQASIVLSESSILNKDFWDLFSEYEVNCIFGVPYTFSMLDKLKATKHFTKVTLLAQAGGKMDNKLLAKYANYAKENNKDFYVMYGQTEASPRISYLNPKFSLSKIGSIGKALDKINMYLIDENNNKINTSNTEGELCIEAKSVALGYASSYEDLQKGDVFNGVLKTGDIAKYDEDGFFFVVGRKSRFLKVFGNRVSLDSIEDILRSNFCGEFLAHGRDDLITILSTNKDIQSIKKLLSNETKLNKSAFKVQYIQEIPKNQNGKPILKIEQ